MLYCLNIVFSIPLNRFIFCGQLIDGPIIDSEIDSLICDACLQDTRLSSLPVHFTDDDDEKDEDEDKDTNVIHTLWSTIKTQSLLKNGSVWRRSARRVDYPKFHPRVKFNTIKTDPSGKMFVPIEQKKQSTELILFHIYLELSKGGVIDEHNLLVDYLKIFLPLLLSAGITQPQIRPSNRFEQSVLFTKIFGQHLRLPGLFLMVLCSMFKHHASLVETILSGPLEKTMRTLDNQSMYGYWRDATTTSEEAYHSAINKILFYFNSKKPYFTQDVERHMILAPSIEACAKNFSQQKNRYALTINTPNSYLFLSESFTAQESLLWSWYHSKPKKQLFQMFNRKSYYSPLYRIFVFCTPEEVDSEKISSVEFGIIGRDSFGYDTPTLSKLYSTIIDGMSFSLNRFSLGICCGGSYGLNVLNSFFRNNTIGYPFGINYGTLKINSKMGYIGCDDSCLKNPAHLDESQICLGLKRFLNPLLDSKKIQNYNDFFIKYLCFKGLYLIDKISLMCEDISTKCVRNGDYSICAFIGLCKHVIASRKHKLAYLTTIDEAHDKKLQSNNIEFQIVSKRLVNIVHTLIEYFLMLLSLKDHMYVKFPIITTFADSRGSFLSELYLAESGMHCVWILAGCAMSLGLSNHRSSEHYYELNFEVFEKSKPPDFNPIGVCYFVNLFESHHYPSDKTPLQSYVDFLISCFQSHLSPDSEFSSQPSVLIIDITRWSQELPDSVACPFLFEGVIQAKERSPDFKFITCIFWRSGLKYGTMSVDKYQYGEIIFFDNEDSDLGKLFRQKVYYATSWFSNMIYTTSFRNEAAKLKEASWDIAQKLMGR